MDRADQSKGCDEGAEEEVVLLRSKANMLPECDCCRHEPHTGEEN
jgi:hypothetical protein